MDATIIIKLDLKKLENPNVDIVNLLSKRIEEYTNNGLTSNGNEAISDNETLIFFNASETHEIWSICKLFKEERIGDNDLLKSSELFISSKGNASIDECLRVDYRYILFAQDLKNLGSVINVTDEEIDIIEKDLKISFPPKLREFYKQNNGKEIELLELNDDYQLCELYPLKYGRSVEYHKFMWFDWLKEELIPIGETDLNDDIFWNTKDNKVYRIYSEYEEQIKNPELVYDNIEELISNVKTI